MNHKTILVVRCQSECCNAEVIQPLVFSTQLPSQKVRTGARGGRGDRETNGTFLTSLRGSSHA